MSGEIRPPGLEDDAEPRRDYDEIARVLGADLLGYDGGRSLLRRQWRSVQARLALDLREALLAWARADRYGAFLTLSEKSGLPLAALLRLSRRSRPHVSRPHVMVTHKLSSPAKQRLFGLWPLQRSFARVVCLCDAQYEFARARLGLAAGAVVRIANGVDDRFFRPEAEAPGDYVLSVGRELRDYDTLVSAMAGSGIRLVVVDSSSWLHGQSALPSAANLTVLRGVGWRALRTLYAGARLVVVPLRESSHPAGCTGVLEAMATAKAVVVTRGTGVQEYVRDGETARCVAPRDAGALRDAVLSLYHDAGECRRLGAAAREDVVARFALDRYVADIAALVRAAAA